MKSAKQGDGVRASLMTRQTTELVRLKHLTD